MRKFSDNHPEAGQHDSRWASMVRGTGSREAQPPSTTLAGQMGLWLQGNLQAKEDNTTKKQSWAKL